MNQATSRSFSPNFRQIFLRGLVVLLPSVLTLWIVVKAYQFVDNTIAEPINRGVRLALVRSARYLPALATLEPTDEEVLARATQLAPKQRDRTDRVMNQARLELRTTKIGEWWSARWYMDLIGIIVAISAVYVAGRLLGGFVGRRLYRRVESLITQLPIFKQVYPYVKQIVDFLFSDEQPMKFNRVVVVEYPRKGIWSVGFMTGSSMKDIAEQSGDSVTVFIPSSPTPFTGYTITIPRDEALELPISVDEAIRFAVSGGVLIPEHQSITGRPELIPIPASSSPGDTQVHGTSKTRKSEGAEPGAADDEAERRRNAG